MMAGRVPGLCVCLHVICINLFVACGCVAGSTPSHTAGSPRPTTSTAHKLNPLTTEHNSGTRFPSGNRVPEIVLRRQRVNTLATFRASRDVSSRDESEGARPVSHPFSPTKTPAQQPVSTNPTESSGGQLNPLTTEHNSGTRFPKGNRVPEIVLRRQRVNPFSLISTSPQQLTSLSPSKTPTLETTSLIPTVTGTPALQFTSGNPTQTPAFHFTSRSYTRPTAFLLTSRSPNRPPALQLASRSSTRPPAFLLTSLSPNRPPALQLTSRSSTRPFALLLTSRSPPLSSAGELHLLSPTKTSSSQPKPFSPSTLTAEHIHLFDFNFPSTRLGGRHIGSSHTQKPLAPNLPEVCLYKERDTSGFDLHCVCKGTSADCSWSSLFQMERIPTFDRPVTKLVLRKCAIYQVRTSDYFVNVKDVAELDMSRNDIKYLHPDAFSVLTRLKVLHFGGNRLQCGEYNVKSNSTLQSIFALTSLEKLYLTGYDPYLTSVTPKAFGSDSLPNVTTMWLDGNRLGDLFLSGFKHLKKLQELNVRSAKVTFIHPYRLPSLERLWAANNEITRASSLCHHLSGERFFPRLAELDLSWNKIRNIPPTYDCPVIKDAETTTSLDLSHNSLPEISWHAFENIPVTRLNLVKALSPDCTIDAAFYSRTLTEIDLSSNGLDFASDVVLHDAFHGCSRLSELRLNGNSFRFISREKFYSLTSPLQSLKKLFLVNTQLDHISSGMLRGLKNVTEMDLSYNMLRVVPDGTFDDLRLLSVLRLDGNLISTVSEKTFSAAMRSRLKSLNLSNNPFECTCSLLWFRQWLQTSPALFDYPRSPYKCSNMDGADVATFVMNEQQCLLSHEAYVVIVVCFSMLLLTLTLMTLVYRYRWHIRLLLYEAYRGERLAKWHNRPQEDFKYDVFVCHDNKDLEWVWGRLVPVLEQQMGLRLCVHQRDFIPGKNVVDNIVDYLQVSKRVLAVFSPNFAQSHWCHFELNLCLNHVVENDDVMVVVMLREVPARDVTGAMAAVMRTTTYIEWAEEPEAVDSFWRRMTLGLRDVLPGVRR